MPALARRASFGGTEGSCSKTSRPAPAISPASSILMSALSSMISPRAVFTMMAPGFMSFSRRADSKWKVAGVCGQFTEMMSTRASI